MDNSGVTKFVNNTGKYHLTGTFVYECIKFEYDILLPPFNLKTKLGKDAYKFVVDNISKRKRDGKHCLGIDETVIREYLDRKMTSAYGFMRTINKHGLVDEASGSIQLYDWYKDKLQADKLQADKLQADKLHADKLQAWLGDLCRVSQFKSNVSPTKLLIAVLEQFIVRNTTLREIHLMIEPTDIKILGSIYEKYGFRFTRNCLTISLIPMKKNIVKIVYNNDMSDICNWN